MAGSGDIVSVPLAQIVGRRIYNRKVEEIRRAYENGDDVPPVQLRQGAVDRFQISEGRHRVSAAERAGFEWIDAILEDF